jgi:hypothetical protein
MKSCKYGRENCQFIDDNEECAMCCDGIFGPSNYLPLPVEDLIKETTNTCFDCIKFDVCKFYHRFLEPFNDVIEVQFGTVYSKSGSHTEYFNVIAKHCKYYKKSIR